MTARIERAIHESGCSHTTADKVRATAVQDEESALSELIRLTEWEQSGRKRAQESAQEEYKDEFYGRGEAFGFRHRP